MMSLDDAIIHCQEVADGFTSQGRCKECADEHRQLANWLIELKLYREIYHPNVRFKDLCE